MSDKSIINVRERPLSSDIMLLQSLQQRTTAEIARFMLGSQFSSKIGTTSSNTTYPHAVAMGLQAFGVSGDASIIVQPGILMYASTVSPTALSGADSQYRVGYNRNPLTVACPNVGGSLRMCLLIAAIQEVIAVSETRDIMNASTAHFEPTIVAKVREWRVALSWVQGAAGSLTIPALPATFGGVPAIPICAVAISGTNQVLSNLVIDLRPTPENRPLNQRRQNYSKRPSSSIKTSATPFLTASAFSVSVSEAYSNQKTLLETGGGLKMFWGSASGAPVLIDAPTTGGLLEPGGSLQASTWYYVYLAPWDDYAPGSVATTQDAAGVLVFSANAPDDSGYNTSLLNLPTPFSIYPCAPGRAPCVGVLFRNPQNSGWAPMYGSDGIYKFSGDLLNANRLAYDNLALQNTKQLTIPTTRLPINAKWIRIGIEMTYASATSENIFAVVQARQETSISTLSPIRQTVPLPATDSNGNSFGVQLDMPFNPSLPLLVDVYADLSGVGGVAIWQGMDIRILEVRT